jgi:uroporphyrinogen decarboxylase
MSKTMTHRERLQAVLAGKIPDCVPVAPDISNMVPAKLTGKPFWDLYLYNDPPICEAYIAAAKHYDIDSVMDGYFRVEFPNAGKDTPPWKPFIVARTDDRITTQNSYVDGGKRIWATTANVYYVADSPTCDVPLEKLNLPAEPVRFEPVEGAKVVDHGPAGMRRIKQLMGDQGLVGVWLATTNPFSTAEGIYEYYDNPDKHEKWAADRVEVVEKRFAQIQSLPADCRPDFLCVGGSGTLIFQTLDVFRQLSLPAVKRAIELATAAGYPTHIHSCGPETALIKLMAEETTLTVIDPLEIPPMGDCNLAEIKKLYGQKLTLKGNLHTTEVMLRGSPDDVVRAAKQAIDDGAAGGRFILSTGDQCGRDTPPENLRAMVETARTYGRY